METQTTEIVGYEIEPLEETVEPSSGGEQPFTDVIVRGIHAIYGEFGGS
jgi:hypothetical protein